MGRQNDFRRVIVILQGIGFVRQRTAFNLLLQSARQRYVTDITRCTYMAETLANKTCTPCRGGVPPLTREQAELLNTQAPDWQLVDDARGASPAAGILGKVASAVLEMTSHIEVDK